jgi:hypothetical protein
MAAEIKYEMTVHPTAGLVRSQSDGAKAHAVTLPSCDCADYINRKGRLVAVDGLMAITLCKHIVEFLERVGGWNRAEPVAPARTVIFHHLTHADVKRLLQDNETVGFSIRGASELLRKVSAAEHADFEYSNIRGKVEYNRLHGHYTLTLTS